MSGFLWFLLAFKRLLGPRGWLSFESFYGLQRGAYHGVLKMGVCFTSSEASLNDGVFSLLQFQ